MFIAICLVAVNMRITLTGVGPLLTEISESEGIPLARLGALGSVPLLVWALVSPFAHWAGVRLGLNRTILWALVLLACGTGLRTLPGSWANLWFGTALIGVALAIANVLMPAIIKRSFAARTALVMGAYSALQGIAGAPASGLAVPISLALIGDGTLGWRTTLLFSGALVPLAILIWAIATRTSRPNGAASEPTSHSQNPPLPATEATRNDVVSDASRRIWRDPLAWTIAVYAGAQSTVFYTLLTWLATFEVSAGRTAELAGVDLMLMQLFGVLGSACFPLLFRTRLSRFLPATLPALMGVACVGIAVRPAEITWWSMLAGFSMGALFTTSLTLMAIRARNHHASSALSGMAQSVGYVLAAAGPVAFGLLHSLSGGWQLSFGFLIAVAAIQVTAGAAVAQKRYVLDSP